MRQVVIELDDEVADEYEEAARLSGLTLAAYLVRQLQEVDRRRYEAEARFWDSIQLSHLPDEALRAHIRIQFSRSDYTRFKELQEVDEKRNLTDEEHSELDRIKRKITAFTRLQGKAITAWIERHGPLPERTSDFWIVPADEAAAWAPS
jgi:hypothetical protein